MSDSKARIPIFPLGGAILFPRSQLPLHIFEPRYRDMVSDALGNGGRIGMVQPLTDDDNHQPLYPVGCLATSSASRNWTTGDSTSFCTGRSVSGSWARPISGRPTGMPMST